MINYNPKSWLKLIFALHKSDTIRILWKELLYILAFSLFVTFLIITYYPEAQVLNQLVTVYSLIGFVISLLLVFRTNTAYDRWWEGRKKWGELVNDTRNLAAKIFALDLSAEDNDFYMRMIGNFVFAMKEHLRKGVKFEDLHLLPGETQFLSRKTHLPLAIAQMMQHRIKRGFDAGTIKEPYVFILDKNVNSLLDSLGACERIKNTPIPYSYSLFLKKFIFIYVTTMPLAFAINFGYAAALITTYIFYVLVSMEVLAEEIEDPFGSDDNDLPTDQIAQRIRGNIEEVLLPPPSSNL